MQAFIIAILCSMAYAIPTTGPIDTDAPTDVYPNRNAKHCANDKSHPYYQKDLNGGGSCICPTTAFIDTRGFCRSCPPQAVLAVFNNSRSCSCSNGLFWNPDQNTCECPGINKTRRIVQDRRVPCEDANNPANNYFINPSGLCKKCPAGATVTNGSCQCPVDKPYDESIKFCQCYPQGSGCYCTQWDDKIDTTGPVACKNCLKWNRSECGKPPPVKKPELPDCVKPHFGCTCITSETDTTGAVECKRCLKWNMPACTTK